MTRLTRISALAVLFTAAAVCLAQTAPAPATGVSFGVTTSAMAIVLNGQKIPAADAAESLAIVKSNSLGMFYIEGHQIMSTDQTFNAYLGGVKWTPDIDHLLGKTLLPTNTFNVSFHAAPGVVRNSAGRTALGGTAGLSLDYAPSSNGHFAVNVIHVDYLNATGFGRSPSGYALSSGIAVYFGGTK